MEKSLKRGKKEKKEILTDSSASGAASRRENGRVTAGRHTTALNLFVAFLLLNTGKLVLFNTMLLSSGSTGVILYKTLFTLLFSLALFPVLFRTRSRLVLILLYLAQSTYIFSYMSYYAYFNNYLHLFQATSLLTEGLGPIRHFTIPVKPEMALLLLDFPVFLRILLREAKSGTLAEALKPYRKPVCYSSLALLVLLEIINYASGVSILQLNRNFYKTEPKIIERYGTFVNNISDITVNYGGQNMINHFEYGRSVSAFSEIPDHPNIVAIQVESMDSNIVNQMAGQEYVMPYLHQTSSENIYYPYVLSYHKSGGTSDAEFSILNSIEPLGNYPSIKIPKYTYPNSLARVLDQNGYRTMAFHGNIGNYYNRDVAFRKMGFGDFFDINGMKGKEEGWGLPDHEVFRFALDKMGGQAPTFSYIITMSSHMPFTNVLGYYKERRFDSIRDETVRNYFTAMSYVDRSIRDFVEEIRNKDPNTVILIWGDHTPGILSEDYRQASFTEGSSYFEFVPFFLLTPDGRTYKETSRVASFLDVAPTILYETGIKFTYKTDGVDLAAKAAHPSGEVDGKLALQESESLPDIPFKEKHYDRHDLFTRITQQNAGTN